MGLLSLFLPKTIIHTSSRYNRDIRVVQYDDKPTLLVDGSPQSGPYIEKLWQKALVKLRVALFRPRKILVLGVGGGTVIRLLAKTFPSARVSGVDIDPVIIKLGKKHFGLAQIPRFTIRIADARNFVATAVARRSRYNLVIVDLFSGRHIPPFAVSPHFLKAIREILTPGGRFVINYLREYEYKEKSEELYDRLLAFYFSVEDFAIARNRFFCARR